MDWSGVEKNSGATFLYKQQFIKPEMMMIIMNAIKIALDCFKARTNPFVIWLILGKNLNTLKILNILKRRNASITERFDKELSMNNVVIEGTDKIIMKKSNLSQPLFQNFLKPYSLIFTIISITKKIVIRMSKCKSIEFRIPDSVKNIIIVLMLVAQRLKVVLLMKITTLFAKAE